MTAPDKIWATEDAENFGEDKFHTAHGPMKGLTEYTRTSLAQAAVAAAYEAAAQVAGNRWAARKEHAAHLYEMDYPEAKIDSKIVSGKADEAEMIASHIRALATPDQSAALAAKRAATVTVKPLVWVQSHLASWNDDWHTVPTAYSIRYADENGWKWSTCSGFGYCHSAEAAKAAAQADYDARIRAAITIASGASPGTITLPRAEVKALMEAAEAGLHRDNCPSVEFSGGQCDCGRDDVLAALATLQERMK